MKIKRLLLTADAFVELCKGSDPRRVEIVAHALPADARAVHSNYDPQRGLCQIFVESESFDEVPDRAVVPELPTPMFQHVCAQS